MSPSFTLVSRPLTPNRPETGSFAPVAQPAPPANSSQNPALIAARNKLLTRLPLNMDQPLHELTEASGELSPTSRGTPRSSHHAPADPDKVRENRKKRHDQRRNQACKSGGGLKWGNGAVHALRWGQVKRMWPACLDKLWGIENDEAILRVWGVVKKKLKKVGSALGLSLRGGKYTPDTRAGV